MYDYDISQKCETILNSEPTLSELKGSVGKLNTNKPGSRVGIQLVYVVFTYCKYLNIINKLA
jgi:hypothetical protein